MNGITTASLGSSGYTFFLNVVVLKQNVEVKNTPSSSTPKENEPPKTENLAPAALREENDDSETSKSGNKKNQLLDVMPQMSLNLDKFKAMTKRSPSISSISISNKTAAYFASKTMVSRASNALNRSLPELITAINNLDLTVGKVFQQGSVIVVQVDLKAPGLPNYIAEVQGWDVAEHYESAVASLHLLGASESVKALEQEMLPRVRTGLMEKLSDLLVRKMKEKDESGAPLEVECIALEESEEARWLFTFMEFQTQMK